MRARWAQALRRLAPLCLATALAACTAGDGGGGVPDPPFAGAVERSPRGVVLILVDALRADYLGSYGSPRGLTPNLDRLAERSAVFESAVATSSWTRPSIASLLTSRYPTALGVVDRQHRLEDAALLLPEILREYAGFETFAVSTNGNTNPPWGFGQGYDEFVVTGLRRSYPGGFPIHVAEGVTQQGLAILDRIPPGAPFFLFLHYVDPHDPYLPHTGLPPGPEPPGRFDGSRRDLVRMDRTPPEELTQADYDRVLHLYAGEVAYCDRWIGVFLDELARRGLAEETVVVVTADHGEGLWDHGWRSHGRDLYEETVHVPLILHLPGRPASRVAEPVSLVDVAPTVLAELGIPAPEVFQGADLGPLVRGERREPSRAFVYAEMDHDGFAYESIRHGDFKLIHDVTPGGAEGVPDWQLFDLAADPDERENLYGRPGTAPVNLRQALRNWSLALTAESAAGSLVALSELDRDTLDSLRALGYIGAAEHRAALAGEDRREERAARALPAEELAGWPSDLDFAAAPPPPSRARGDLAPAPGGGATLGRRATVLLRRLPKPTLWSVELTAELDVARGETVTLRVRPDGGDPVTTTVHEPGLYTLRGPLPAEGSDPAAIELSCERSGGDGAGPPERPCLLVTRVRLM